MSIIPEEGPDGEGIDPEVVLEGGGGGVVAATPIGPFGFGSQECGGIIVT